MRVRYPKDTARVQGKTDLAATIARTWIIPLVGRRHVALLLKADATTGNGLATVALASQGHPDCDFVTVTPVAEQGATQTLNDGGVGATIPVAFSNAVLAGGGFVVDVKAGIAGADATFVNLAGYSGYPAMNLRIVATAGAAAATVTGLELIVFEEMDDLALGVG